MQQRACYVPMLPQPERHGAAPLDFSFFFAERTLTASSQRRDWVAHLSDSAGTVTCPYRCQAGDVAFILMLAGAAK